MGSTCVAPCNASLFLQPRYIHAQARSDAFCISDLIIFSRTFKTDATFFFRNFWFIIFGYVFFCFLLFSFSDLLCFFCNCSFFCFCVGRLYFFCFCCFFCCWCCPLLLFPLLFCFCAAFVPESVCEGFFVKKHLQNYTSSTSSHLHLCTITLSPLSLLIVHICTSSHLHLSSSSSSHIYISAHLHICTSTSLLIFTSSSHPHNYISHLYLSSTSHIFTSRSS